MRNEVTFQFKYCRRRPCGDRCCSRCGHDRRLYTLSSGVSSDSQAYDSLDNGVKSPGFFRGVGNFPRPFHETRAPRDILPRELSEKSNFVCLPEVHAGPRRFELSLARDRDCGCCNGPIWGRETDFWVSICRRVRQMHALGLGLNPGLRLIRFGPHPRRPLQMKW